MHLSPLKKRDNGIRISRGRRQLLAKEAGEQKKDAADAADGSGVVGQQSMAEDDGQFD